MEVSCHSRLCHVHMRVNENGEYLAVGPICHNIYKFVDLIGYFHLWGVKLPANPSFSTTLVIYPKRNDFKGQNMFFFVRINIKKFRIHPCKIFGIYFFLAKLKCVVFWSGVRLGLSKPTCQRVNSLSEACHVSSSCWLSFGCSVNIRLVLFLVAFGLQLMLFWL